MVDTITLDDLAQYVPFTHAVLKLDIEGHEWHALSHSQTFFSNIHVSYVLMEWMWFQGTQVARQRAVSIVDYMVKMGYEPYRGQHHGLNISDWMKWPSQIYWKYAK